ncbi:sensor histidine kinase [Nocardioides pantholopis]|uniref:sensor histidine kinase n=1 Tax=Nocardioides pantholopis TaxID=2483798 RepID=UPI000FD7E504|nr:HAMP domain-containing sensor histidine kinase [Nocardioides pantholopis]
MPETSESAELWRLTMQHSPVGMALVGLDGRLLTVNDAFCAMLGRDADELLTRGFQEITQDDDIDASLELVGRVLAGEVDSFRLRKRYLHANGDGVWGDLSVALVRDGAGRARHFIAQILDVSEQHDYELRLQAANAEIEHERQTLEAIFETVNVGLLLIDAEGNYRRMNRRHQETMVLPFPDGHAGRAGQLGQVYHLDGTTAMTREEMPSYRATQGEEFDDYTYWVGADPLTRAAFSSSARQVRGPDGERLGAALAYQEITDLIRAMQVKDEFVSSVSHELRTPLTSVLGHLEILGERADLPAGVEAQLRVVRRNAARLKVLVADLLQVAQAREGSLRLHRAPADLVVLAQEAIETARPAADQAGVSVTLDAPDRLVLTVDAHRISQVLDNLLSNAIKYSPSGGEAGVGLRVGPDAVELEVRDTGMGIARDEIDHVFARFFRGSGALSTHIPGTGLGLNIVNSIVAAHHGSVIVESEPGRGSVFRVTLPAGDR